MPGQPSQNPPVPPPEALRADARHNRERILAAAGAVFAERGIDVPMTTVARRAGVGVATLYRRFPTRDALVAEVFSGQLATCVGVLDEALADPDPWDGFRTLVERLFALQVAERGFTAAVVSASRTTPSWPGSGPAPDATSPNSSAAPRRPAGCAPTSGPPICCWRSGPTAASWRAPPATPPPRPAGWPAICSTPSGHPAGKSV